LGGAVIDLEVASDAGGGNLGRAVRHAVTLVPAPFVALSHDYAPLPAQEGEALPVRATLENTSGCDVTGLWLREELLRLRYVAGSARLDGARVEADLTDPQALQVGPIAISAGKKAVVTWLARAPLRSTPQVTGTVTMRGVPVTLQPPEKLPVAGCGCGKSPMLGGLALLVLVRLIRGRRAGPNRSGLGARGSKLR
jgi:hypothetical protein